MLVTLDCAGPTRLALRLLPRFRGNWLLATAFFRVIPSAARLRFSRFCSEYEISLDLSDPAQFAIVRNANFEVGAVSAMLGLVRAGDAVIDVGANWGYFSCLAACAAPDGVVLAVEPHPVAYARLLETIRRNRLANVRPVRAALLDAVDKTVELVRPVYRQTTSTYVRASPTGMPTTTLDQLAEALGIRSVRLVKIDTEGAELPILRGGRRLLAEQRPFIIAELSSYAKRFAYSARDVFEYLDSQGYSNVYALADSENLVSITTPGECQALFSPVELEF